MRRSSFLTRNNCIGCVLILMIAASGQGAVRSDKLLELTPEDALFCIRINDLDATLRAVDDYAEGLSKGQMKVEQLVTSQLGAMIGDPNLVSIDVSGDFAVFGLPLHENPIPALVVVLPVKDYAALIGSSPVFGEPDEEGISKITSKALGLSGLVSMPAPGNKFAMITTAKQSDALLFIKNDLSGKTLARTLDDDECKKAAGSPIWAWANMPAVSRQYGTMAQDGLESVKKTLQAMPQKQPVNPETFIDMYLDMLEALLTETRYLSLSMTPTAEVCRFDVTYAALADTEMGKMLVKTRYLRRNRLMGYLQNGAAMNFAGKINKRFLQGYYNMAIDLLIPDDPAVAADKEKGKTLTAKMVETYGQNMVGSMTIDADDTPPFAYTYIVELKDPKGFNRIFDEYVLFWNRTMDGFFEKMGMKMAFSINRNMESYKGVDIDSAFLSMKFTDPNIPAEATEMIDKMYGDGFTYKFATIDKLFLCAVGSGAEAKIRSLIDQAKTGGPTGMQSEAAAAMKYFDDADSAEMFGTYNYIRLFKMMGPYMPTADPNGAEMPSWEFDVPTSSNLAFAGNIEDAKATFSIALPKKHLMELQAAFEQFQKQFTPPQPQSPAQKELLEEAEQVIEPPPKPVPEI